IPVLVKQYLKLGGKILAFNVDPDFQNSLDGFIVVDLTETKPAILNCYLGKEGTKKFLAYQSVLSEKPESKTA
ncbi:glycerol acyltransferase, partial [bacterium]|nr:glycerol acyltransferase [bacterium]